MLYLVLGKLIHDERQREIEVTLERRRLLEDPCDEPIEPRRVRLSATADNPCRGRQEVAGSTP